MKIRIKDGESFHDPNEFLDKYPVLRSVQRFGDDVIRIKENLPQGWSLGSYHGIAVLIPPPARFLVRHVKTYEWAQDGTPDADQVFEGLIVASSQTEYSWVDTWTGKCGAESYE